MSIQEKRREAFEAWARKKGLELEYRNYPGIGRFYECPRTLLAHEAFDAALDGVVIDLPYLSRGEYANQHSFNCAQESMGYARKAIESAGLKVKP